MEQSTMDSTYHTSVLLHESVDALNIKPDGVYVDATFGGGGHSKEILKRLSAAGKLIAFDQDEDAAQNSLTDGRFTLVPANFSELKRFLRLYDVPKVNGVLADLGVSGWQFDASHRGFSYRFDGPLDMRMNRHQTLTAADVLNGYAAERLQHMWSSYGEVRNAKTLAKAVEQARAIKPLSTIADLKNIALQCRMGEEHKYLAQVFQAVRIEVNDELQSLQQLLLQCAEVLVPGGRVAIITFHSLEDRLVKNYFKHSTFHDEPEKDMYGNFDKVWKLITKKPIEPTELEKKKNSRSRSAKLRVAEKL